MSVKFKIGFTMDAETLFGIVAKFLPLEHLSVEEVVEHAPKRIQHAPKLAGPRTVRTIKRATPRAGYAINLEEGVNRIVMDILADGEVHRFVEMTRAMKASGFKGTGLGSRLKRLMAHGYVERDRDRPGAYRLAKASQ